MWQIDEKTTHVHNDVNRVQDVTERENNIDQFGLRYVFLGGIWIEIGTFYLKTKFTPNYQLLFLILCEVSAPVTGKFSQFYEETKSEAIVCTPKIAFFFLLIKNNRQREKSLLIAKKWYPSFVT